MYISDTVGFIQKLPTTLIESFKSTLEEAADSDFIIHVIDNNAPDIVSQYDTVLDLIDSLSMKEIPQLILFNKTDLNNKKRLLPMKPHKFVNMNMPAQDILMDIENFMAKTFDEYNTSIPLARQDKLYSLKRQTIVKTVDIDDEKVKISGFQPEGNFVKRIVDKDDNREY